MLQRRQILSLGLGSAITTVVAGCGGGGGDGDGDDGIDTSTWAVDEVLEPGLAPEILRRLPDPQVIPLDVLRSSMPFTLSADVYCGDEAQKKVPIRFYDIDGQLLATGLTDDDGHFESDSALVSRRFVLAVAKTPYGELQGFQLVPGFQQAPTMEVNLYQTLASRLFMRLGSEYNVINYVLQAHFGLDYGDDIWDIGRNHAQISQQKMRQAMLGRQGLDPFLNDLVDRIVAEMNQDAHGNAQFKPDAIKLQASIIPNEKDLINYSLLIGEKIVGELIKFPGSGAVFSTIFGKIRSELLPKVDPFDEVRQTLTRVESRLLDLKNLIVELKFAPHVQELEGYWNSGLLSSLKDMIDINHDRSQPMQPWDKARLDDRVAFLLASGERLLDSANSKFFGCGPVSTSNSYLRNLHDLLKNNKFYSESTEIYYRSHLSNFLMNQTLGYVGVCAAMIYDMQNKGQSTEYMTGALRQPVNKWIQMCIKIRAVEVKSLATQVFIQHQASKAWVGVCNDVSYWPSYVKPSIKAIKLEYDWIMGTGTPGGVNNSRYMLKTSTNQQGVDQSTIDFAPWRLPSVNELNDAFLLEAKQTGKSVAVYAYEQGVTSAARFCRYGSTDPATVVTDSINDKYVSKGENNGGTCDRVYFKKLSVEKGSVGKDYSGTIFSLYRNKKIYAYFPVATLSAEMMKTTLPWRVFDEAMSKGLCGA